MSDELTDDEKEFLEELEKMRDEQPPKEPPEECFGEEPNEVPPSPSPESQREMKRKAMIRDMEERSR